MMTSMPERVIERLIREKLKSVVCVSGVGTVMLSYMTKFPGSSSFFLEGINQYSRQATKKYLGQHTPEKFCSREMAVAVAHQSFLNAQRLVFDSINRDYRRLHEVNMRNTLGVAVNGSLSSNYEKKGRIQCFMSLQQYDRVDSYHLLLEKPRGRLEEEQLFSDECMALLEQFVDARKLPAQQRLLLYKPLDPSVELKSWAEDIEVQKYKTMLLPSMFAEPPLEKCGVFSGSFNPFHSGHLQIYQLSEKHKLLAGKPVILELTLKNADKSSNASVVPRLQSIIDIFDGKKQGSESPTKSFEEILEELGKHKLHVLLSHRGKFVDKQLKNGVHILGADTFVRLADEKFYNNDPKEMRKAFCQFTVNGVSFLVMHRSAQGQDIPINPIKELDYEVVEGWANPVSSTEIRNRKH